MPEGYLSDNEGVEGEHDQLNKPRTANAPKKKAVIRKVVLGPYFEGETDQDETMKPFEMQFLIGKQKKKKKKVKLDPTLNLV